jgi:hypothetical protein
MPGAFGEVLLFGEDESSRHHQNLTLRCRLAYASPSLAERWEHLMKLWRLNIGRRKHKGKDRSEQQN